jgi:hypothetical protein
MPHGDVEAFHHDTALRNRVEGETVARRDSFRICDQTVAAGRAIARTAVEDAFIAAGDRDAE